MRPDAVTIEPSPSSMSSISSCLAPPPAEPPAPDVPPVVELGFSVEEKQALPRKMSEMHRAHGRAARIDWVITRHLTLMVHAHSRRGLGATAHTFARTLKG